VGRQGPDLAPAAGTLAASRVSPRDREGRAQLAELVEQPNKKRLTWGDLAVTPHMVRTSHGCAALSHSTAVAAQHLQGARGAFMCPEPEMVWGLGGCMCASRNCVLRGQALVLLAALCRGQPLAHPRLLLLLLLLLLQAEMFEASAVVPPTEPLYDLTEWVATHFPRYGYAAASPFYVWQEVAAQRLGEAGAAAYYAAASLMASEPHRAALLKMAAHVGGRKHTGRCGPASDVMGGVATCTLWSQPRQLPSPHAAHEGCICLTPGRE
jgi:hypothetical protein